MKVQKFGNPEVTLSWIIAEDSASKAHFKTTLESQKGKTQLVDTILMLLDQGKEIRIGTDGYCLLLEANEADEEFVDASYQYVDEDHELLLSGCLPDGSYEYFDSHEDYEQAIKDFVKEHPYYKQNEFGHWYSEKDTILANFKEQNND